MQKPKPMMFRKLLIANRGEIALRIVRACRELGISPVVVYPASDRDGLWLEKADEAYELEDFQGSEGYLNIDAILLLAKKAKVEAIHPGYGFLSEQAAFALSCKKAGIVFIGPSPEAMALAGDKAAARKLAQQCGIPVLPGTGPLASWSDVLASAPPIGFPLLMKSVAGGGGRGIRLVKAQAGLKDAFEIAAQEAQFSFGDGRIYLEKYIPNARHLEIQIVADTHGNYFYLGERECSIQRRYQKLLEESPSSAVSKDLRQHIGQKAVDFAKAAKYTNVGTVEFLLENKKFHFLEMNARIQVEHPVTEMVTGIDLLKTQIQIAQGEKLAWTQEALAFRGWAFEARINAEDSSHDFLASQGTVTRLDIPGGPGIRVDTALYAGYTIPSEFDSLLAKLISWGETREEARLRMVRALQEFRIGGVPTTIPFHLEIFQNPDFIKGNFSTTFIEEHGPQLYPTPSQDEMQIAALIAALENQRQSVPVQKTETKSLWKLAGRTNVLSGYDRKQNV